MHMERDDENISKCKLHVSMPVLKLVTIERS